MTDQSAMATRNAAFGYVCRRCSRCCRHKHIQLDPYEVARLARSRGESTTQFRARWTVDGQGTTLRQKEDGTCIFLGANGCEVYKDRPMVCRLYPLGRYLRSDGFEYFKLNDAGGEFSERSTIADYLEAQGAKPFMAAKDSYFQWLRWARDQLDLTTELLVSQLSEGTEGVDLLDMDDMIARHCAATGEAEPDDIDDRLQLHLKLLYDLVADRKVNHVEEESKVSKINQR